MAGKATVQEKQNQEVDWARQLRNTQNDFRMKQGASSGLSLVPQAEPDLVPNEQQDMRTLPMDNIPDMTDDAEELSDEDEAEDMTDEAEDVAGDDQDDTAEWNVARQLADRRRQDQLQEAQGAAEESAETEGGDEAGAVAGALDQAGEMSGTMKLFARLQPGDDRNKKVTGKIGFLVRLGLLVFGGLELLKYLDDGIAAMFSSGSNKKEKANDGEKKTDTVLTIALGLSILVSILQVAMPIIIVIAMIATVTQ